MIKLTASTLVLSFLATFAFAEGYTPPTVGIEPVTVAEGADLIVPASVLLTAVAAITFDGADQAPEDVGKIKRKPASLNRTKGRAGMPLTLSSQGLPSSSADASGADETLMNKIVNMVTRSGTVTARPVTSSGSATGTN